MKSNFINNYFMNYMSRDVTHVLALKRKEITKISARFHLVSIFGFFPNPLVWQSTWGNPRSHNLSTSYEEIRRVFKTFWFRAIGIC